MFIWLNTMPMESTRKGMSGATTRTQRAVRGGRVASADERRRELDEHAAAHAPLPNSSCASAAAARSVGRCARRSSSATPRKKARRNSARQARAALRAGPRAALRDYLLDEREPGGGNLAEHADYSRMGGEAAQGAGLYMRMRVHSACAGPSSTARPSNTRTIRSSVARSRG